MKNVAFAVAVLVGAAVLTLGTAQAQQIYKETGNNFHPHFCPVGESWQYGCVKWAPAGPGQLFGACLKSAWSCKRVGGPIQ